MISLFIILASLFVLPKVQAASASAADLLLDFQFNEGEGLTSRSSVGDVTVSLGTEIDPAWTPTGVLEAPSGLPNDRAALFDGNGWLYGEYSAAPIDLTQPLTWEGWIYVDKNSTKTVQDYFSLGETLKVGVSSEHNFLFTFRGVEDVFSNIMVQADENSGSYWTHLACSWDPAGGNTLGTGIVRFYQDGILRQEVDTASRFRAYQANILSVGASNSGDSLFQGMMDRVRLHKALLTDAQLDSDAANPKPITANTVIAYEFNEATVPFLSATSLALPLENGIVADTFTLGGLKYTVLTEEPASKTGTVSVKRESTETSGDIVIPSSVTNEGISYSVVLIPKGAFSECCGLTSIIIPESVTSFGDAAFWGCSKLTDVTIGRNVTVIGNDVFSFSGLTSIVIPDSVTSLGNAVFFDCNSLTNATIGNSVTVINDSTFSTCNNLKSVIIGNSVTSIERAAFFECTSLTNVTIGNSVTAIGSDAFAFSGLKNIMIPESVTSIGGYAFNGCSSLTGVYFRGDSPNVGNGIFEGCRNLKTIYYFEGKLGWTNPWNGIETVAVGAEEVIIVEQPQSQLILPGEKATLKATVFSTAALNYQWYKDGFAIEGATHSTYVIPIFSFSDNGNYAVKVSTPSQSVTSEAASLTVCTAADQFDYTIEGERVIINGYLGSAAVVVIPPTIEDKPVQTIGAFAFSPNDEYPGRVNLAKVLMPDTVTDAGINAFGFCFSLTNIVLSPNLATLSNRLLEGTAIESITIPKGTTSMQAGAFHGCENLKNVFIEEENPSYVAVDNVVFTKDLTSLVFYPAGIITERYDVPTSVTTLAPESFDGTKIEYLSIPESVTTLEGSVFSYGQFGYIEFPESITSFPDKLFLHCSGVSHGLVIPASVTSIGENCFYYTSITKFYFEGNPPSEVAEIAFPGTSEQAVIYVRSENAGNWPDAWYGMPVIETNVFPLDYDYSIENNGIIINAYNRDDTELEIPETMFGYSVVGLAADACNGEENIVSIIVPATVTQIGDRAFANCASLKSVFFLGNAPEIGTDLFLNTSATVYYQKGTEGWSENWAGVTTVTVPVVTRSIERDGNIATVTLSIETTEGVSAVFVEETIQCEDPFTVTPQDGGVFNTQTSTIRWAFLSGDSREVTYTLSVAEDCKKILALRGNTTFSMDVAWENEIMGENEINFSLLPPEITKQPEGISVGVGVKIKLDVFAQGDEPLTYQWYKDGVVIENATESAYEITGTVLEDSGSYTVSVRNRNGHVVSNAAVVEVVEPAAYGEATRSIVRAKGNKAIVTLKITPTENISAYFVEEQLPNETTVIVSDISNQGAYNEELNKIRWAFLDGKTRTISYTIVLPSEYRDVANWYGEAIFDVMPVKIIGMESCDFSIPFPEIVTQPQSMSVDFRNSASFTVVATGGENLSYQWFFNKEAIIGATAPIYSIESVLPDNAGLYSVEVSNEAGTVTSQEVSLTLLPPRITKEPLSMTVNEKESFNCSVTAEGSYLSYQWYFNGTLIEGAINSSYSIASVRAANVGDYVVIVSNGAGSVTSQIAHLDVMPMLPPTLVTNPTSITVYEGDNAEFSVVAEGQELTYQWYFNETLIEGATDSKIVITEVVEQDAGSYTVAVSNEKGTVTSQPANLNVILFHPADTNKNWEISSLEIAYYVRQWVSGVVNDILTVAKGVQIWQSGGFYHYDYRNQKPYCWIIGVGDPVNTAASENMSVSLASSLEVNRDVVFTEDGKINVTVHVSNLPESFFTALEERWIGTGMASGVEITDIAEDGVASVLDDNTIAIRWAVIGEFPETFSYTLAIKDGVHGELVPTGTLTLTDLSSMNQYDVVGEEIPTNIMVQPESATIEVGDPAVTFGVAVIGTGYDYQWYRFGSPIFEATDISYSTDKGGEYVVTVSKEGDSVTSHVATLIVDTIPEFIAQPQNQTVTVGESVELSGIAYGTAPLAYQWYKNGTLIEGATADTLYLEHVTISDAGNYTLKVVNDLGSVISSPAIITINQALPVITWATPAAITYGTALSAAQLNATANVEGSFAYTPAAGTKLNAGTHQLSVNFTPTDAVNYTGASKTVEIVVNKATPVITWATPAAITYGTALSAAQLNATANVEGSFAYTPAAGTKLEEGTHTLSVAFTPTDTTNYNTATAGVELVVKADLPPALSYALKDGKLILTYSGGKLEVSDDLVHWSIVDEDGEFEVTIGAEKKKFYRVVK